MRLGSWTSRYKTSSGNSFVAGDDSQTDLKHPKRQGLENFRLYGANREDPTGVTRPPKPEEHPRYYQ